MNNPWKNTIGAGRKSILSLFSITCILLCMQKPSRAFVAEDKLPKEIEFRLYFHCYNYPIDWAALIDLKNNPILNACTTGATAKELESLQIPDLEARLQKLQNGKLIRKVGPRYHLNFPAIVGKKQTELKKLVESTALKLLPASEKMTQEVAAHLKGHEEMLYHLIWSIIMDGPVAWDTLENELIKQLKKADASISGTIWMAYPNHPYRAGTNTYNDLKNGAVKITWSLTTPMPPTIHEIIKRYESELFQSVTTGRPVEDQRASQALAKYGLVDEKGIGRVYLIDPSSQMAQTFGKISHKFGTEVMTHLDLQQAARMLGVTPVQALIIVYHELCYVLLEQLARKKILEVPEIVLKPGVELDQTFRLVSVIDLRRLNSSGR